MPKYASRQVFRPTGNLQACVKKFKTTGYHIQLPLSAVPDIFGIWKAKPRGFLDVKASFDEKLKIQKYLPWDKAINMLK